MRVWNTSDFTKHSGPRCSRRNHSHHHNQIIIIIIIACAVFVIFVCLNRKQIRPPPDFPALEKRRGGWRRGRGTEPLRPPGVV